MYNMIIIDDDSYEISILQTIVSIPENVTLSHTFVNSTDAVEYLEKNHVDIIISDIKMPIFDGIDIAKLCYEKFPHIKVILISAYRDFEYARSAIKYNVVDYIKKPINIEELSNAICDAVSSLTAEPHIFHDNPQSLVTNSNEYIAKTLSDILLSPELSEAQKKIRILLSELVVDSDILNPSNADTASASIAAANDVIAKALKYMQDNLDKPISLTDVATHVHNNPTYFSRYFKSRLNKKFIDVLKEMRLERAMHLLITTNYSISVISEMVGYSSVSYFHTLFQRYYNTSPADARNNATAINQKGTVNELFD